MADVKGKLEQYASEINELIEMMEKKKKGEKVNAGKLMKDLMKKIVNDVYNGIVSPDAIVELNNIIRSDYSLERNFLNMIPSSLLGHKKIFNNLIESINMPNDIEIDNQIELLDILSDKSASLGALIDINNEYENQNRFPKITYLEYKRRNDMLIDKKYELAEQCENNEELEELNKIEEKIDERGKNVKEFVKAKGKRMEATKEQTTKNDLELTQGEKKILDEINARLTSHDFQGVQDMLNNVPSETVTKFLTDDKATYPDAFIGLLPKEIMEENKSIILEKCIKMCSDERSDLSIKQKEQLFLSHFMSYKSMVESGLSNSNEINSGIDKGYKQSFAKYNFLEFIESNFEEIAEYGKFECKSMEELMEEYNNENRNLMLSCDYGVPYKGINDKSRIPKTPLRIRQEKKRI